MTRTWTRAVVAAVLLVAPAMARAQQAPDGTVEVDPIRCWWKADRSAVHIGERFTLTLTCAVVETRSVTVVPATTPLDPGALPVTPFEVVAGTRRQDVIAAPWRYLQYDYTVRLAGEGFFGQDVAIPSIPVTYAIRAAAGGTEGRERTYLLPALPIRIVSLVPQAAADIRDTSADTFAAVESRQFRARAAFVVAGLCFAGVGVVLVLIASRAWGRARETAPAAERLPHSVRVLGYCRRALEAVHADALRDGWTAGLARRASAPVRIAAAIAVEQPLTYRPADRVAPADDGQIAVSAGWWRPRRLLLSATVTPATLARALAGDRLPPAADRATVEQLHAALRLLETAGYGAPAELDAAGLNRAVEDSQTAVRRLRRAAAVPTVATRALAWLPGRA